MRFDKRQKDFSSHLDLFFFCCETFCLERGGKKKHESLECQFCDNILGLRCNKIEFKEDKETNCGEREKKERGRKSE